MKILSITILRMRSGADTVYLKTDLPEAAYPYAENLELEFKASRESAEEYCKRHFPDVPIETL